MDSNNSPSSSWSQGPPPTTMTGREARLYDAAAMVAMNLGLATSGHMGEISQRAEVSSSRPDKFVSEPRCNQKYPNDRRLPNIPTLNIPGETSHPYPHYAAFSQCYQPLLANVMPVIRGALNLGASSSPESAHTGNTCHSVESPSPTPSYMPDVESSCGPKGRGRPKGCKGTSKPFKFQLGDMKKPFICAICQKAFRQKSTLLQHERIHLNSRPYKCSDCGKEFRQQTHLTQHVRIHTDEKPYPCEHCGRAFRQRTILNQHLRIHTGAKPYECPQCGKCFRQKAIVDQHVRTHQGDRPYCCPVPRCRKRFSQISDLNHHLKLHEENPNGGPQPRRGRPTSKKVKHATNTDNTSAFPTNFYLTQQYMGAPVYPGVPGPMTQLLQAPVSPTSNPPTPAPPAHNHQPSHTPYIDQQNNSMSESSS